MSVTHLCCSAKYIGAKVQIKYTGTNMCIDSNYGGSFTNVRPHLLNVL
jgi:hypothetical protein